MNLFGKLFGTKESENQNIVQPGMTNEQLKEAELMKTFNSIYPYFKRIVPSDGNKSECLPHDFSTIDNSKIYSIPGVDLVVKNICDDLNCLYAIDNETGLEIIQERQLQEWKITKDMLHEMALANYRFLISEKLKTHGDANGVMFIVDGNLEAGLILIDEIWEQMENQLGEEIVIVAPSRDVLFATGKSKSDLIERTTEKAKEIFLKGDHSLSKNWFIRQNNAWKVFQKIMD
jgi:hypothetical protein